MTRKLYKSNNRVISGVCGGIAEYFDFDPTIVRLAWAILTVFTSGFPGLILYIVAAIVMPSIPPYDAPIDSQGN